MTIDLNERIAHDPENPEFAGLLSKLQGNILKGHGREHTINLFFRFERPPGETRKVLGPLAQRLVTSALKQHRQSVEYQRLGIPGDIFASMLFSASGMRALGLTDAELEKRFPEPPVEDVSSTFKDGMKKHAAEFGDPDPGTWEEPYSGDVHLLILLADDDRDYLLRQARLVMNELARAARIVGVERGATLRDAAGQGIEHFGYVDGRSQPIFLRPDLEKEGATDIWNPVEPLSLVLVRDLNVDDSEAFGSYYVFRKLEQNVLAFHARERALAEALQLADPDAPRAGAMAIGRFRDGTPVVLSETGGFVPPRENNFRFEGKAAERCPFHAHIRKANPRGDLAAAFGVDETQERSRRIARRGIPYGTRARPAGDSQALAELPTAGVGLLFGCFQASIGNQFAFMQRHWLNSSDFVNPNTGPDPLTSSRSGQEQTQTWPRRWAQPEAEHFDFGQFVAMKGGEYFFAPSIPFFTSLSPSAPE